MKTLVLSLLLSLSPLAHAELPPELRKLPACQSQAAIPLVFNADHYLVKWYKDADVTFRFVKKAKDRCAELKKKFPGEAIRLVQLKTDRAELMVNTKKKKLKQEEVSKYIADLRKDMEKYGGKDSKACVEEMKKAEQSLAVMADALEEDAASICE